jgi:hypothetical protein
LFCEVSIMPLPFLSRQSSRLAAIMVGAAGLAAVDDDEAAVGADGGARRAVAAGAGLVAGELDEGLGVDLGDVGGA